MRRPPDYYRDHARPVYAPAPGDPAIEARLTDLISPATYVLTRAYHDLGLRWRILNLPVMVALVLALIWRHMASVTTLLQTLDREPLLWSPPLRVSQQAFSLRLRSLPADLFGQVFHAVLPELLTRAAGRTRAHPVSVTHALRHFTHVRILDTTTLEALFRKVGQLREAPLPPLGGKVAALLDLPSKLPVQVWFTPSAAANDRTYFDAIKAALTAKTLAIFDGGFYAFPFFDWLTEQGIGFITRAHSSLAFAVQEVLVDTPRVRDRLVRIGLHHSNPCRHPVRLVEVQVGTVWYRYLTNVLDPAVLSTADIVDLYSRRWRIEDAFFIVKRLLGLSYLWTGASNGIALQVWATWLLYAVLIDLSDAVANALNVPLEQVSVEMVYRSLYHFTVAYQRGEASDPVAYLAAQTDLGIVKRRRKYRERAHLDKWPSELNL
jgi:hypothetical protein